jgi:hypothetical protein
MTRTKTTDSKGNVTYELREGDEVLGYIRKASGYYRAELPSGNGQSVSSIRKGEELISFWQRLAK